MTINRPAPNDITRHHAGTSNNPSLSGALDPEIEALQVALSLLRTQRDTLSPMSHMFDGEEESNLEEQIEDAQHNLENLMSLRSPIARLSEESLFAIISYAKWFPDANYRGVKMPQILACALVSKRWHRIVASSPYMWDVVNANWTVRKIKRWFVMSRAAKLHIKMCEALEVGQDSVAITRLISTELSRIRSLQIITSPVHMDEWRRVLDHDAPMMETLSLYITDTSYRLNLTFPATYFHGRPPPLLRKLEFYGPHIVWTSPHLRNLTCLRIQGRDHPDRPHVPLAQVLRSLQYLPLLQHLEATGRVFPDDDDNPQSLLVTMSRLKLLRFEGMVEQWCPLFIHLRLPFATEIDLRSTSRNPGDVERLFDHLTVHFRNESGSAGRKNKFDSVTMHQDEGGLRLQAECTESTGRSPLRIDLKFTGLSDEKLREEVYVKFATIVPVSRATRLCLTGTMPTRGQWEGIDQAMGLLTVLRLGQEACGMFPCAVLKAEHSLFMGLLRIEIEKAPLHEVTEVSGAEVGHQFWEDMENSVVKVLEGQMVERPGEEHLSVVRFLRCSGDVDENFRAQLCSREVQVEEIA